MLLTKTDIKTRLRRMPGWEFDGKELSRDFKFASFKEAMFFANAVAGIAEAANHHPEIDINYDRVEIDLTTHSEGGVTEKDFALAARVDEAAAVLGSRGGTAAKKAPTSKKTDAAPTKGRPEKKTRKASAPRKR